MPTQEQLARFYASTPEQQAKLTAGGGYTAPALTNKIDKYLAATPEQQAKLNDWANFKYDQTLATPEVDWNTTHQGAQVDYRSQENQPGSASLTQSGANTGNLQPMFTSYYQPMGGSTFIGVKADGSKEFITENQARDMGFVPNPRQSGDFYDLTNTETVPGGDPNYIPGGQTYYPPVDPNPGGGGANPNPGGGGNTGGGGGNTGGGPGAPSWNWDAFSPKSPGDNAWGGYDADYSAFERYQPGMESPWGMPNVEGGNKEFYQQQFANQLREEQNFRARQNAAAVRGQEAADQPPQNIDFNAMWSDMGYTPNPVVQAPNADTPYAHEWIPTAGWKPGDTNRQVFDATSHGDTWSPQETDYWSDFWAGNPNEAERTNWSQFTSPNDPNPAGSGLNAGWHDRIGQVMTNMFNRSDLTTPVGGGPTAVPGYASPI